MFMINGVKIDLDPFNAEPDSGKYPTYNYIIEEKNVKNKHSKFLI